MNFLKRLFRKERHVWKETHREDLGHFLDFEYPHCVTTCYRIAVYEECLLTGKKRIREIHSLFPHAK